MAVRFEPFEVDVKNGRLLKHGVPVPLREQAFQVLLALIERPGETVTRAELQNRLWAGTTTVDFDTGVNTAVSRLRDVLGDDPESPRFVQTVPKRGYRFIAALPKQQSVAVIPLLNRTADLEAQYFAEGVTEDLIGALSRIDGVRVAATSLIRRFNADQYDPRQAAKELAVDFLIEGSFRRTEGRIRIHLHLVNGVDGFEIWSELFDVPWSNILSIPDRVATSIAYELKRRLLPEPPHTRPANASAYEAYVKGHYLLARDSVSRAKALDYLEEAIRLDPEYALPYHAAVVGHILRAVVGDRRPDQEWAAAERLLDRGLSITPDLALMQNSLGMLRMFQCRFDEAESAYQRALLAEPDNALVHMMYALQNSFCQRHELALQHAREALALDPLHLMTNFRLLQSSYYARHYDEAIKAGRAAIELAPDFSANYWYLGWTLLEAGSAEEAFTMSSKVRELDPNSPASEGQFGYVAGRAGHAGEARAALKTLQARRDSGYSPAIPMAWTCIGLGDIDAALTWLELAFDEQEPYLAAMLVFPGYDRFRQHPRFISLIKRLHLKRTSHGKLVTSSPK